MTQESLNERNASAWSLNCVKCETDCDTYESKVDNILSPNFGNNDIILQSTLGVDGKDVQAYLCSTEMVWVSPKGKKNGSGKCVARYAISINNVIGVYYQPKEKKKGDDDDVELFPSQYFVLHFAKRIKCKWKAESLLFTADDSVISQSWVERIQRILKGFERPRKLLVFINPVGGKKLAKKIFREKVAQYFDIAKVQVTEVTTERVDHAKDYIVAEDLTTYDGVISVGGDGLCSEVINGMLQYKDGIHQCKMSAKNKPLMLGIIPAGSTDTVAYCTSGTNDPVTAALNIILGRQLPLDICSVWQHGHLLKYSMSLMGYGYFGDVIKESQNLQWLGVKRYDLAGFKRIMINKSYEGEVRFIKADDNLSDNTLCKSECIRCSTFIDETDLPDGKELWQTVSGRFISVIGANITCRCARSSTGISPLAHTGDGYIDLILIRKTTRARYLQHLIKVSEKTVDQFNFNFIEVYRVKEFTFNPMQPVEGNNGHESVGDVVSPLQTSVWNIDGELVESPHIHIMVHRQLISLYASGIEE